MRKQHEIVWERIDLWGPRIEGFLPKGFKRSLRAAMARKPLAKEVDFESWLNRHIGRRAVKEAKRSIFAQLSRLSCRTFHACRPVDPKSYLEEGIRVLDPAAHRERLWDVISGDERLSACRCRKRFEHLSSDFIGGIDEGKLFLVLDIRYLLQRAGHYLIWGSESWSNVLCRFGEAERRALEDIGIPTVFKVVFRLAESPSGERKELAHHLFLHWAYSLREGFEGKVPVVDFTFTCFQPVAPERIVGHFHPEQVKYPNRLGEGFFANRQIRCVACDA